MESPELRCRGVLHHQEILDRLRCRCEAENKPCVRCLSATIQSYNRSTVDTSIEDAQAGHLSGKAANPTLRRFAPSYTVFGPPMIDSATA